MTHGRLGFFLLAAWAPAAAFADLAIETFAHTAVGQPPAGWKARRGNIADVYVVQQDHGQKFLRADAKGVGVMIGKELKYDVKRYPVLTWRWRAHTLPRAGDERNKETNDSAAGVYVVFGGWPIPNTIKYVWGSTLPVGTRTDSPFAGRTKIVVVESGPARLGEWVEARVNVLADYHSFFGEDPPPTKGIGILSDADNTGSRAAADYADIVARAVADTK